MGWGWKQLTTIWKWKLCLITEAPWLPYFRLSWDTRISPSGSSHWNLIYQEELGRCGQGGPRFRAGPEEPDQGFQLALCPRVARLDPPIDWVVFVYSGNFSDGVFDTYPHSCLVSSIPRQARCIPSEDIGQDSNITLSGSLFVTWPRTGGALVVLPWTLLTLQRFSAVL